MSAQSEVAPAKFLELIRLRPFEAPAAHRQGPADATWYESLNKPFRMGNTQPIAFGGCTLAVAMAAVHQQLESQGPSKGHRGSTDFAVYTFGGYYLRPSFIDRNYKVCVVPLRSTRTFETKQVYVYQANAKDAAVLDLCLSATCDFMRRARGGQDGSVLKYSLQPHLIAQGGQISHHSSIEADPAPMLEKVQKGEFDASVGELYNKFLSGQRDYIMSKHCPEGVWAQNAWGTAKYTRTTQDHLPVHEKTGYDWFKVRGRLSEPNAKDGPVDSLSITQSAAADALLSWHLDGHVSFAPLSFSHRFLEDAAACATLDFCLRFHQEDVIVDPEPTGDSSTDEEGWFLREIRTHVSNWERTYSQAVVWSEEPRPRHEDSADEAESSRRPLRAVATMTQTSILKNTDISAGNKARL
ncbi:unnamed protein product [Parajaminaea phylloscopi]